jgi:hypothetical protein
VCALLRNQCAACSGIGVRLTPESMCALLRILQNWNPKRFLERKKEQYMEQKYLQFHFDINHLNKLKEDTYHLEKEIERLKN